MNEETDYLDTRATIEVLATYREELTDEFRDELGDVDLAELEEQKEDRLQLFFENLFEEYSGDEGTILDFQAAVDVDMEAVDNG